MIGLTATAVRIGCRGSSDAVGADLFPTVDGTGATAAASHT